MPISNEVIELEPVKKSKLKLIISIVIAGVMVALAVTFLVMYIMKPDAQIDTRIVRDITVTETDLFDSGEVDASGHKLYSASAGNTYTIYASVSAEGGAESDIRWDPDANDAYSNPVIKQPTEEDNRGSITFTVNKDFADSGKVFTITARAVADTNKVSVIYVKPVNQATEHILFDQYYWRTKSTLTQPAVTTSRFDISKDTIDVALPAVGSPTFTVYFRQKGKINDAGEYAQISYGSGNNNVSVKSSNESIIHVDPNDVFPTTATKETGSVAFTALGVGTAKLIFTADGLSAPRELTVNVKSCEALNYIEKIYISQTPVDADFFKQDGLNDNNISDYIEEGNLTLVRNNLDVSYRNIYDHIIISPLSVQYDKTKGEIRSDWQTRIKIETDSSKSQSSAINIMGSGVNIQLVAKQLAKATDCALVISDGSQTNLGAKSTVGVNIIAGNTYTGAASSLKNNISGELFETNNKQSDEVYDKIIDATQNSEFTLGIRYTFTAPTGSMSNADLANYISKGFILEFDDALDVRWGSTVITSGKTYSLDDRFEISKSDDVANTFYGETSFAVTFNDNAESSDYSVKFKKVSTALMNTDSEWSKTYRFRVSLDSIDAGFINQSELTDIVTKGGTQNGYFAPYSVTETDGVFGGTLTMYIQHPGIGETLWFKTADLIRKNAGGTVTATEHQDPAMLNNTQQSSGQAPIWTFRDKFSGDAAMSSVVTVKGVNGQTIGVFNIIINVFDAYDDMAVKGDAQSETEYAASDINSIAVKDTVTVNTVRNKSMIDYDGDIDVDLAYSINEIALSGEWQGNAKVFWLSGDDTQELLFKFTKNAGLIPLVDLFAYSYKHDINLSRITVTYSARNLDSWKVAGESLSCSKVHIFSRKVDGVKLYKDNSYKNEIELEGNYYQYPVNHDFPVIVYISSYINIDGEPVVVKNPAVMSSHTIASYVEAYFDVKGTEVSGLGAGKYKGSLSFTSPILSDTRPVDIIFDVYFNGVIAEEKLKVTVSNEAREVSGIVFTDENGKTLTDFKLGNFGDGVDPYGKTVIMKVTYVDYDDTRHTSFAPVKITFPEYVRLLVDNNEDTSGEHTFTYVGNIESSSEYSQTMRFELIQEKLTEQKYATGGQPIGSSLASWNGSIIAVGNSKTATASFTVGTSVMEVKYQKYDLDNRTPIDADFNGSSSNVITVDFVLDGADEAAIADAAQYLRLRYYSYAVEDKYAEWVDTLTDSVGAYGNGYYVNGILYDKSKMNFGVYVKGETEKYGNTDSVIFEPNSDTRMIKIMPNLNNLRSGTQNYDVKFVDNSSGKTFTLQLCVTIRFNVFSVTQGATQYNITTTGENDNTYAHAAGTVVINGGNANYAPSNGSTVEARIVDENDDTYDSTDIYASDVTANGFTVYVKNSVKSVDKRLYVVVKCGGVESRPIPLNIMTDAVGIRLASGGIIESGNVATVAVTKAVNNFALAAELYDLGTLEKINGDLDYAFYRDPECTQTVSYASYVNGNIVFGAGAGLGGTAYLKASAAGNDSLYIVFTVNYTVEISSDVITFENIPANLYYCDASNYTEFDFNGHIKVNTVLGDSVTGFTVDQIALASGGDNAFTVVGTVVRPTKSTGTDKFTVTVRYDGKTFSATTPNWMGVRGISFSDIADAEINVVESDSCNVVWSPSVPVAFDGALAFVSVNNTDKFVITDNGNGAYNITVNRDKLTAADYIAHTFKATLVLTPTAQSGMSGIITLENEFVLTLKSNYTPKFSVRNDSGAAITGTTSQNVNPGDEYTVELISPNANAQYDLLIDVGSDIVRVSENFGENGIARIEFTGNAYGPFKFMVKAVLYGREHNSEWFTIQVCNGGNATAELYVGDTDEVAADSVEIDYDTAAPTYTYRIDTAGISTGGASLVSASDITVIYTGDVTATGVTRDAENNKLFYVTFTVSKPTTLNVEGTILVKGVAFHLPSRTVAFTATEPEFTVEADKTALHSGDIAHIIVNKSNLDGLNISSTVVYEAVGDQSNYVTVGADGTVTAKQITSDRNITVRVTVTVENGAYDGKVYTYTVDIALKATTIGVTFDYSYDDITGILTQTVGTTYVLPIDHVRVGYTFGGWFTDTSYTSDKKVTADSVYSDANVSTLYALWTANTYTVSFDSKGGSAVSNTLTVTYDGTFGTLPVTAKDGYVFAGWYTDGGVKVESADTVNITEDITLTARWTASELTLTFDANGGDVEQASKTVYYDGEYGTLPTPTQAGNAFIGWFTAAEGGTQVTDRTVAKSSATVYAHWTVNVYNVYINYNGYDSTGLPLNKQISHGEVYGLIDLTRVGYTFDGWYTDPDYAESGKINVGTQCTESGTVYAKWTANPYTVRFNGEGGTPSKSTMPVTFGSAYGTLATATREDSGSGWFRTKYTFAGWYTTASGDSGVRITSDSIVDRVSEASGYIELYARWNTATEYTIVFNANGGVVDVSFIKNDGKTGISASDLPTPTKNGYRFDGWFTQKEGGTQVIAGYKATADVTLYAHWTALGYYVTFKSDGAQFGETQRVIFDSTYAEAFVAVGTPEKTGYTFVGWFIGGKEIGANDTVNIAADTELTAEWAINEYIIVIDYNGGSGNKAYVRVNHGDSVAEALAAITLTAPTGYKFSAWQNADGTAAADRTVRATWSPKTFTVTFDANGGSVALDSKNVTYGAAYGELPVPEWAGHTFAGWYINDKEIKAADTVDITADTEFVAHWTVDETESGGEEPEITE